MAVNTPTEWMTRSSFFGFDWAGTPLGAAAHWPSELRQIVSIILDSVQPMFVIWGAEKTILFNNAFCGIMGGRFREALGQPLPELWKEAWAEIEPYVEDAIQGQSSLMVNQPYKTWASSYQDVGYFTFSYTPLKDSNDAVCGALCIANDTTDSVRATAMVREERDRLRNLFNEAPVFLAMGTSPEMRFTYANRRYEELVGKSGLVGQTVAEVLPEAAAQGFLSLLEGVQRSGTPYVANHMPYIRHGANGLEERFIDFIYQPVFDGTGRFEGILCAGYDVTEQHEAREEAARLRGRLESAARLSAAAHMAATLAHELNQPLAAAMNYANAGLIALPAGLKSDPVKLAFEETLKQIQKTGEIIRRARKAFAQNPPAFSSVNLYSLVGDAVKSYYAAASMAEKVAIRIGIDTALNVQIDQVQIEQVLQNLFRNAAAAMNAEGFIDVTARAECDFIVVSVRDSGRGLPPHLKEDDLFVPFVHSGPGMGLGLSLSRTIIEAHGGRIRAENAPDGGAVISFSLPALAKGNGIARVLTA